MKKAYSFKTKNNTQEIHIFEGSFKTDNLNCETGYNSICNKMNKSEGEFISQGQCNDEQKAREKAAMIGRDVCGDCVSHLYKSY